MNEAIQFLAVRDIQCVDGGYIKVRPGRYPKKDEWAAIELLTTQYGFDVLPYKDAEPMTG